MKTITIIIISVLLSVNAFGQTKIVKSNISSGGGTSSNGNISIIYTIGEFAIQESTDGTVHISEGFISPGLLIATGLEKFHYADFNVQIFPNPAVNYVNVKSKEIRNFNIQVFDMNGKLIMSENSNKSIVTKLNISHLKNGEYFLVIKNEKLKQFKTFKLIKQ
jgi:hypothetical protein